MDVWARTCLDEILPDILGWYRCRRLKETADDVFPVLESVWPTRAHIYPHNIQHGSQTCISVPFLARGSPALVWIGSKRVPMTSARDPALVSALTVGQTDRAAACVCWQSAGRLWWWLRFSVITAWSVRQTDRARETDESGLRFDTLMAAWPSWVHAKIHRVPFWHEKPFASRLKICVHELKQHNRKVIKRTWHYLCIKQF